MTAPQLDPALVDSSDHVRHCVCKIQELVRRGENDSKSVLQIGYNLGRLSELTGLGRTFWDSWKNPISSWNQPELLALADKLGELIP